MIHFDTWRADRVRFSMAGAGAQNFLSMAARYGVRLHGVRYTGDGYVGIAAGQDRKKLEKIAARGGWTLTFAARRGPGALLDGVLRRPGLAAGALAFFLLARLLGNFVWAIDFASLDGIQQQQLRTWMAGHEVYEGCYLTQETLQALQESLALEAETYGWLSLNFTGGCLFVESTPLQSQQIESPAQGVALYAKADAQVLATDVESGFCVVQPGQYVAGGQLLANATKLDRSGGAVVQSARGGVLGRIEKSYTAAQPFETSQPVLALHGIQQDTLYLLGRMFEREDTALAPGVQKTEWLPLQWGRVALPGCIKRVTTWEQAPGSITYSPEMAGAMARRSCRLQLLEEYPDAQLEEERFEEDAAEEARCTAYYVFQANIAIEGDAPPAAQAPKEP